ncbi:thioesterase II family protein [Streptomyces coeruleoprunus]|uniref:Thioesterase II family protein n=1 Tax=Streptomyces coeruleoprunus TaxID=285563 RepID=A0ABV9XBM9_9ACTN
MGTYGLRSWLHVPRPRHRPALRLVCFPPAGGTARFFAAWGEELPDSVELAAVQYPGREDRAGEPPARHVDELARPVAGALTALAEADKDVPLVLFGHGLGAAAAFETARLLHVTPYAAPRALFVSAHPAPTEPRHRDPLARLDDTPVPPGDPTVPPATAHADLRLATGYRYRPGPPLDCPVTALVGTRDPRVTARLADGWRSCTTGPFTLRAMPGDHFYLVPRRAELVAFLLTSLGARDGRTT